MYGIYKVAWQEGSNLVQVVELKPFTQERCESIVAAWRLRLPPINFLGRKSDLQRLSSGLGSRQLSIPRVVVSYCMPGSIKHLLNLMTQMLESVDIHSQKNPAFCNG